MKYADFISILAGHGFLSMPRHEKEKLARSNFKICVYGSNASLLPSDAIEPRNAFCVHSSFLIDIFDNPQRAMDAFNYEDYIKWCSKNGIPV